MTELLELPEIPICYTRDLNGGWEWCSIHHIAFQHEVCPVAEKLRKERDRIKQELQCISSGNLGG